MNKKYPVVAIFFAATASAATQTVTLDVPVSYLSSSDIMQQYDMDAVRKASAGVVLSTVNDTDGLHSESNKLIHSGTVINRRVISRNAELAKVEFEVDTAAGNELIKEKVTNHKLHQELMSLSDNLITDQTNPNVVDALKKNSKIFKATASTDGHIESIVQAAKIERENSYLDSCFVSATPVIQNIDIQQPYTERDLANVAITFSMKNIVDPCLTGGNVVINIGKNRFTAKMTTTTNTPGKYNYYTPSVGWAWGDNFMTSRVNPTSTAPMVIRKKTINPITSQRATFSIRTKEDGLIYFWVSRIQIDSLMGAEKASIVFVP